MTLNIDDAISKYKPKNMILKDGVYLLHEKLLIEPMAQNNIAFTEALSVHAHNDGCMAVTHLMNVNRILPPSDTV